MVLLQVLLLVGLVAVVEVQQLNHPLVRVLQQICIHLKHQW
jgi:hypothetical protein